MEYISSDTYILLRNKNFIVDKIQDTSTIYILQLSPLKENMTFLWRQFL